MKLYSSVDRIYNELRALGKADDDTLTITDLVAFDQYHYHGIDAVQAATQLLKIGSNSRIIEVGAGIGGPARYLTHSTGCHVTAVELQPDLNATATALTRRCDLENRIDHVCADFLSASWRHQDFDALVSWLAFYHIADHELLFSQCYQALKPGGVLYVEDLCKRGEFTPTEQQDFSTKLYGQSLPSFREYEHQIRAAGFDDVEISDLSEDWTQFCRQRVDQFRNQRVRHVDVYGTTVVDDLDDFYATVSGLFEAGNLGGIRVSAAKG